MKHIVPICRPLFDRAVALVFLIVLAPILARTGFAPPDEGREHFGPSAISCVYTPLTNFQDCGLLCAARSASRTSSDWGEANESPYRRTNQMQRTRRWRSG